MQTRLRHTVPPTPAPRGYLGHAFTLILLSTLGACSSPEIPSGQGGGRDAAAQVGDDDCVAALALDACCTEVRAVTAAQLRSDPCLVPAAESPPDTKPPAADCAPAGCEAVDCEPAPAFTRVARPGPDGTCALADECAADDDCEVWAPERACNCCEGVGPTAFSELAPGLGCQVECSGLNCAPQDIHGAVCRLGLDGLHHCEAGPSSCDAREVAARAWTKAHAECSTDEDCSYVGLGDVTCLAPFLCGVVTSATGSDLDRFRQGASELAADYRDHCNHCPVVDCISPESADDRVVCRNQVCELE